MAASSTADYVYQSMPSSNSPHYQTPHAATAEDGEPEDGGEREQSDGDPAAAAAVSPSSGRYWLQSAIWLALGAAMASLGFAHWWKGQAGHTADSVAAAALQCLPANGANRTAFRPLHSSYSCLPSVSIGAAECRIGDQPPFSYNFLTHRWPTTADLARPVARGGNSSGSGQQAGTAAAGRSLQLDDFVPACPVFFACSKMENGLGDQLRVYLSGVQYAAELGIRFVHTPLTNKEKHFESFMRLGDDEAAVSAVPLQGGFKDRALFRIQLQLHNKNPTKGPRDQLQTVVQARCPGYLPRDGSDGDKTVARDYLRLNSETVKIPLPQRTVEVNTSATPYILVQGWQYFQAFCSPCLILQLKRKYCLARVRHPLPALPGYRVFPQDDDGMRPVLHVAVHYRGGDLAFGTFLNKRWTLERLVAVMLAMDALLNTASSRARYGYSAMEFSVFSQSPEDESVSWQEYFAPVMAAFANRTRVHWHIDLKSEVTFDALVRAPILIRGGSGFTNAIAQFRYGVDVSNQLNPCDSGAEVTNEVRPRWGSERAGYKVDYAHAAATDRFVAVEPDSGRLDAAHFHALLADYVERFGLLPLQLNSEQQCHSVTVECVSRGNMEN